MSRPRERSSCSLHVLVSASGTPPDPCPLAEALAARLTDVTVALWTGGHEPALSTVEATARIVERLEVATGRRPRYVEVPGDLDEAVEDLLRTRAEVPVVLCAPGLPRRARTAVRRAVLRSGAHVALAPAAPSPEPIR